MTSVNGSHSGSVILTTRIFHLVLIMHKDSDRAFGTDRSHFLLPGRRRAEIGQEGCETEQHVSAGCLVSGD